MVGWAIRHHSPHQLAAIAAIGGKRDRSGWPTSQDGAQKLGGSCRAAEHLRLIGVELQMVPVRNGVHIGGGDFFKVHPGFGGSGNLADIQDSIGPSAKAMLDDMVWWAKATMTAKV